MLVSLPFGKLFYFIIIYGIMLMVIFMYNKIYQEKEFYRIAEPILRNTEFQRRKLFLHHNNSVYDHSISVALVAYRVAKYLSRSINVNIQNVVVGALLHDFYLKPWRENKHPELFRKHGFTHGKVAAINSNQFFPDLVNKRVMDSIQKHMFPLTLLPPKYIEGWIVTMADKYVSLEVFSPSRQNPPKKLNISYKQVASKCRGVYNSTKKVVSNMY